MMKNIALMLMIFQFLTLNAQTKEITKSQGDVKRVYYVSKDNRSIKNGSFKEYFKGDLTTEGQYVNNERDSFWRFLGGEDGIYITGFYKDGLRNGKWITSLHGRKLLVTYYKDNEIDSLVNYGLNKKIIDKIYRVEDAIYCEERFTNTGVLLTKTKYNGISFGKISESVHFNNGQLHQTINFTNNHKNSSSDIFGFDGEVVKKSDFKDGRGTLYTYDFKDINSATDSLRVVSTETYNLSKRNGIATYYDKLGKVKQEGDFKDDSQSGDWEIYENGVKKVQYFTPEKVTVDYSQKAKKVYPFAMVDMAPSIIHVDNTTIGFNDYLKEHSSTIYKDLKLDKDHKPGNYKIFVQFKINQLGEMYNIRVKANHISDEQKQLVKNYYLEEFPRFNPGIYDHKPVDVVFTQMIRYRVGGQEPPQQ